MKILFDTSVLVAAVVKDLPQHKAAYECLTRHLSGGSECCCSTHALAECYSTLTALPLPRRISPAEAVRLIEANFETKLTLLDCPFAIYREAIARAGGLGLRSGIIYDALHLVCAEAAGCAILYSFNLKDFLRLEPAKTKVMAPD